MSGNCDAYPYLAVTAQMQAIFTVNTSNKV